MTATATAPTPPTNTTTTSRHTTPPAARQRQPVGIDSPELEALLDRLAEIVPGEGDADSIRQAITLIRDAGLGTLRLPREEGFGGASLRELFEVAIRIAEINSSVAHILRNHFGFVERALYSSDNPKYRRWLDEVRAGRLFGLGYSELGTQNIGTGTGDTVLSVDGDGYRLSGTKYYSTGNYYTDFLYIAAQLEDGQQVAVVIPADREGVRIPDDWDGFGQKLTASGTTFLTNVRVERAEVIGIDDHNRPLPVQSTFFQLYLTSIIVGIIKAIVRDASRVLTQRTRNFYHAVAAVPKDDPLLQQTIGRLASIAYVAESAVLRAVDALELAHETAKAGAVDDALFVQAALRAAKTKIVIDDLALEAASRLFEVGGASAATTGHNLDRHWRNIRTLAAHNPVSYKARAVGRYELDKTPLPNTGFF